MPQATSPKAMAGALGVAQRVAWGTLYYAVAVLGAPMQKELGLTNAELFACFAWSLGLSGLLAPWAGRQVDLRGGRAVLVTGLMLGAAGFIVLALARSPWMLALGWTIQGVAMALGLYDTCFAAIGQASRARVRSALPAHRYARGVRADAAHQAADRLHEL